MGILSSLQSDPRGTLIQLCYLIPAVLISLTLHELAHGFVAYKCGDPTAKMLGRLTFNPLKHLDPLGSLYMVLFGFGWARPVPINSRNFKHFRRDEVLVALAGVTVNFLLFFVVTLLTVLVNEFLWKADYLAPFDGVSMRSYLLSFDTLPLYYSYAVSFDMREMFQDLLRTPWLMYVQCFLMLFARINLALCLFNLLPIPPLDGYHVVNDILLKGKLRIPPQVLQYLLLGLMVVMFATRFVSDFLSNAISFVQGGVLSGVLAVFGLR